MKHATFACSLWLSIELSVGFVQPLNHVYRQQAKYDNLRMVDLEVPAEVAKDSENDVSLPDMTAFSSGYKTVFKEQSCQVCKPSFGQLPSDLKGTYYRCGPSMFSAGSIVPPKASIVQPNEQPVPDGQDMDRMALHPFEADGGVLAVTINSIGEIVSRFRYVRTNAFYNERRKGKRLYRGMDSTREVGNSDLIWPTYRHHLQPGLNKQRKNNSNTRVVYWGKRLITLWEGGLPYKLDDLALSTEGRSQLGGVLKESDPFGGAAVFDSKKNRMIFYTNKQDSSRSELTVYEFNSKFRLEDSIEVELPGFALISDFAVTENYYIFVQPPVSTNSMQFLFNKEPGKVLKMESGPSILHLIPRDSSKNMISLEIPFDGVTLSDLKFVNAFNDDNGSVIFDVIRMDNRNLDGKPTTYPWAASLEDFSSKAARRDLVRYTVSKNLDVSQKVLSDIQCYFGVINAANSCQQHQFIYLSIGALGNQVAPPQGIAKFDTTTGKMISWMPESFEFCGEPMFVPSTKDGVTAEDEGYIMSVLYNGKLCESELIILSAKDLSLQVRAPLGIAVPHGLHGCFNPGADFKKDEIERRAKLADKMESRGNMWNEVKSDFSGLGLRLDDWEEFFGDIV